MMITKMIYVYYTNDDALVSNCGNTIPKRFADEKNASRISSIGYNQSIFSFTMRLL